MSHPRTLVPKSRGLLGLKSVVSDRREIALLVSFAVIFTGLTAFSLRDKSATMDEPAHLVAGYVIVAHGDYRIEPAHPPFLRVWAALPLLAMNIAGEDTSQINGLSPRQWLPSTNAFIHNFLYRNNDADRLLNAGRFMIIVTGLGLGALLFFWAREWLGFAPAAVALAFYTIEPNIAAHSRLVTTDVGATCFIFGTIYFLWRTSRQITWINVAALTVFCALAVISKFSAVLLAPIVGLLLFAAVLKRYVTIKAASIIAAILLVASFGAIWAAYDFRYAPSDSPEWLLRTEDFPIIRRNVPFLADVLTWVDARRILPNAFTQGFLLSQATSKLPAYLMGSISNDGWWYYFPIAFLVKTPTALIVLFFVGLYAAVFRRASVIDFGFVLLPIAVYSGFAIASGINIGIRHLLPVYPFVLLAAAFASKELLAWARVGRYVLAGLTAFSIATFFHAYPHTLTFFNVLAGGPGNGLDYLADSNLDWGQDLKLLKTWMEKKNVRHINLAYFGSADPEYYGISCTHLPGAPFFATHKVTKPDLPGYVAISATALSGIQLAPEWRMFYRGFLEKEPVVAVGNSIFVYWVERWPEVEIEVDDAKVNEKLADGLLVGLRWPEHAVVHYQASLESAPDDPEVLQKLALALTSKGDYEPAIAALRQAMRLAPENGGVRRDLASALVRQQNFAEAAEHAQAAVRLMPDQASAHDVLGLALTFIGKFDEAEAAFRDSLRLDPSYEDARKSLAVLQDYRKRH